MNWASESFCVFLWGRRLSVKNIILSLSAFLFISQCLLFVWKSVYLLFYTSAIQTMALFVHLSFHLSTYYICLLLRQLCCFDIWSCTVDISMSLMYDPLTCVPFADIYFLWLCFTEPLLRSQQNKIKKWMNNWEIYPYLRSHPVHPAYLSKSRW